jgi:hypothetical protein
MVRPGIKKNKVQNAILKNDPRLACLMKKISEPKNQVKKPLNPRKAMIMIYAMRELKNVASSRLVMIHILFIVLWFSIRLIHS